MNSFMICKIHQILFVCFKNNMMCGHVERMWERNVYRVFVWENEMKGPPGRLRYKWEVSTCI